ncbi:HvfC/BufC N-terminal domain-containing protein [Phytohabitans suffuscus]|uniref:HvfC/BufC N-terminal domain-containing protein n=1 Tax=Phytohabitans suffuscus TaxID=624315 RepID=UPI0022B2A17E|nr:DNA-binding domain-containing protein [Phytohabitans suffuscus]
MLREELAKAAAIRARAALAPARPPAPRDPPPAGPAGADGGLSRDQRALQAAILDGPSQVALPGAGGGEPGQRPLSRVEGISIYGGAYRARRVDGLRRAFPVLRELVGAELDGLALDHLAAHPGQTGDLAQVARSFAGYVCDVYRHHQWAGVVRDVVALDLALADRAGGDRAARTTLPDQPAFIRDLAARAGVALDLPGDGEA